MEILNSHSVSGCPEQRDLQGMMEHAELERGLLAQEEFLGADKPVNRLEPLVSVCVVTYQQARFIGQCLDSILMQRTSFPFEIIHDAEISASQCSSLGRGLFCRRP